MVTAMLVALADEWKRTISARWGLFASITPYAVVREHAHRACAPKALILARCVQRPGLCADKEPPAGRELGPVAAPHGLGACFARASSSARLTALLSGAQVFLAEFVASHAYSLGHSERDALWQIVHATLSAPTDKYVSAERSPRPVVRSLRFVAVHAVRLTRGARAACTRLRLALASVR